MYDELIKELRFDANMAHHGCNAPASHFSRAADVIEEISREYESVSKSLCESVELCKRKDAKIPRWIPVTERLPEPGEWVLAWSNGYTSAIEAFLEFGAWIDDAFMKVEVTHWMPLPQPPKEVE